jgi:hypothetical protein
VDTETAALDPGAVVRHQEDDMTTITQTYRESAPADEERDLTVDSLDIRHAVIGDGVMLTEGADHRFVIHSLGTGRAELVGEFNSPADALNALDEIELSL